MKEETNICDDCCDDIPEGQEVKASCGDILCARCAKDHPCV